MVKKSLSEAEKLKRYIESQGLTLKEAEVAIKSAANYKPFAGRKLDIGDKSFSYAYFSDPHIGEKQFKVALWDKMVRLINQYQPDFVVNAGDTLEGMSGRPGHIYELSHVGFSQQINYATELLNMIDKPIYAIDGNHDEWFQVKNSAGAIVGEELEHRVKNWNFLGQMEGDLNVDGIKIKLYHGRDGTAYADSYKIQKLIESFTGGEKPHIVHSGHYHKHIALHRRNVFGVESGTLCGQTRFMRGKKIPAHMGFGFVTVYHNGKGKLDRIQHEFVPYYERKSPATYIKTDALGGKNNGIEGIME